MGKPGNQKKSTVVIFLLVLFWREWRQRKSPLKDVVIFAFLLLIFCMRDDGLRALFLG